MKIENAEQLRELYGFPSGRAKVKVLQKLDVHSKNFIEKSPFLIMATTSEAHKQDASPRGGTSGFVKIINSETLVIPDSKGNNRLDSLTNILETGVIGLIFLIPGVDETLRINGKAHISTNSEYLNLFDSEKNPPKTCIVVSIQELFLHCAKAFMRSKLWNEETKIKRSELPTMGQMLNEQLSIDAPVETQKEMVERYHKDL